MKKTSLSKYPVFKSFETREITLLESVMVERELTQGHFLFRKGDVARECFFLLEGNVFVGLESDSGFQRLAELVEGDIFGELALLDGGGRSASCRVGPDGAKVGILGRGEFDHVFNSGQPFAYSLLDLIADRLIDRVRGAVVELGQVMESERDQ